MADATMNVKVELEGPVSQAQLARNWALEQAREHIRGLASPAAGSRVGDLLTVSDLVTVAEWIVGQPELVNDFLVKPFVSDETFADIPSSPMGGIFRSTAHPDWLDDIDLDLLIPLTPGRFGEVSRKYDLVVYTGNDGRPYMRRLLPYGPVTVDHTGDAHRLASVVYTTELIS